MSDRRANYELVGQDHESMMLRDLGPWDQHPTITNAAEIVVEECVAVGLGTRRLFYYDSEGDITELLVKDGEFAGFAPCLAGVVYD